MKKTLLKGGTIVSGSGMRRCDLLIEGEEIIRMEDTISCEDAEETDVPISNIKLGYQIIERGSI